MGKIKLLRKGVEAQDEGLYFSSAKEGIQFIGTGCLTLDLVIGGGWPLGRIANIVGDKSTGKTLLAMEAIANFCRTYPKGLVRYNETEAAFEDDYARALGIPMQRVDRTIECRTVEDLFKDVCAFVDVIKADGAPGLYIVDSLDALSDAAEMESDIDKGTYGANKAKLLSQLFRRLVQDLKSADVCVLIISQVRDAIGIAFGDKHTRSGGKALDFYASQVLWLAHMGILKRTVNKVERPVGVKIKAKCKKNKVGLPFRECEFEITFGYGVEDIKASEAWLKEVGLGKVPPDLTLDEYVTNMWYAIEKTFLPTRRKYQED